MVEIINENLDVFLKDIQDKFLIIFGAGVRAKRSTRFICNNVPNYIVDNNSELWGTMLNWNGKEVPILSIDELINIVNYVKKENIRIFITSAFHALDIIFQLDKVQILNGVKCYIYNLLADNIQEQCFNISQVKKRIPAIIHYCWFGKEKMPEKYQTFVDGWKKLCPDFEFKLWNENNYDITKNKYMLQAYEKGRYGFVPDYARLDIIYNEGGIYLDVDIELIRDLSDLRYSKMFCCFMNAFSISLGAGFGAEKNNELIKQMRDHYDAFDFIDKNGNLHLQPCTEYQDPILEKFGFKFRNMFQNIDEHVVYPAGFIISRDGSNTQPMMSYTKGIHHGSGSWAGNVATNSRNRFKEFIEKRV